MSSYDEVDLEDMEWNAELGAFTFQCPCGDVFQITPAELRAGEEIAHCPSCSLVVTVVYEDDDLKELIPEGF
jgi:diphthamide biosynthesis protein 3